MTTWVLLRGLTREARHWGDFGERLDSGLGGATVLAVDLPGNGAFHAAPSPTDVAGMVRACRASLAQIGAQPPFVPVALSLGGMVALEACCRHPAEFTGAVLINTSMRGYGALWQRLRPANWGTLARLALRSACVSERELAVLAMTSRDPETHRAGLARWEAIAAERPVTRLNALRQLVAAARYAPPRHGPRVPMLLLASEGDRLVSPQCSQRFARRWDLPLRLHPWAGHDLPLDDPAWVVEQIAGWRFAVSPETI